MTIHQALLSFNNGEGSPYFRRRIDFDKTSSTCETMRNFIPMAFGAVTKRPGLLDLAETLFAGLNSKAFPFVASNGSKYIIHFTNAPDQKITIYRLDGTEADQLTFYTSHSFDAPFLGDNSIRDLQMENVNDVAFFTHPRIHPFRIARLADGTWQRVFVSFRGAPMLDENLDENKVFSVTSNPVAPAWSNGEDYTQNDTVFFGRCEWECTHEHSASTDNRPGTGDDWRDFWMRKFYRRGAPITITAKDKDAPPAWQPPTHEYSVGDLVYYGLGPFEPGNPIYRCITSHTADGSGSPEDDEWEYVDYPTGHAYNPPNLIWRESGIYECILYHANGTTHLPTGASDWATYWVLNGPFYEPSPYFQPTDYHVGDEVTRKGRVYRCIADHTPDTAVNRPGTGSDWQSYWLEISQFLEGFAISSVSPGTYWRLSPERDSQDFQIELTAIEGNDGRFSDWIAVDGAWNIFTYGEWHGTFIIQKSTDRRKSSEVIRSYQATGDRNVSESGFEDTPCLLRLGFRKQEDTADDGDQRALLIPETSYISGEALMTEYVDADEMRGVARTPMLSGSTFRWAQGAFSEEYGFPRCVALHNGPRLVFGSTTHNPISTWISAADDLTNFKLGTEDDDALFETLPTGNQSPIRWIASLRRLFYGTALGEWVVGSETSDAPLTPTNYSVRTYTGTGSISLQPVKCASGLLFAGRKGGRLYELQYTTEDGYEATDLSRLADHLTKAGIISMAWQQTREPGMWAVTREGGLLHFAYMKSEKVFAWSRHDTEGGIFRDVVVFPSDAGDDEVFFIVDRGDESFLCRFRQHWQATMEAGTAGANDYTDGAFQDPIVSELITLPIDVMTDNGTSQGRTKRPHKVILDLYNSRGGHVWNRDIDSRQPIVGAQAGLVSGWTITTPDAGALEDMQLKLFHADPQPFTLRCGILRWVINEP